MVRPLACSAKFPGFKSSQNLSGQPVSVTNLTGVDGKERYCNREGTVNDLWISNTDTK